MENLNFKVDLSKCVHCGLCVRDCSCRSLVFDKAFFPKLAIDGEKNCFGCQHCMTVCPTGAISILGLDSEESVKPGNTPSPDSLLDLIKLRRSCRMYSPEPVGRETIDKLLDMESWVPTGVNACGLHACVVDDIKVMDEIRALVNVKVREAVSAEPPTVLGRQLRRYRDPILAGADIVFRGAPHFIVMGVRSNSPCAATDPVIALSYFELYANAMGLGTTWCGLIMMALNAIPEFAKKVALPEGYVPGYAMLFGHPEVAPKRAKQMDKFPRTFLSK